MRLFLPCLLIFCIFAGCAATSSNARKDNLEPSIAEEVTVGGETRIRIQHLEK